MADGDVHHDCCFACEYEWSPIGFCYIQRWVVEIAEKVALRIHRMRSSVNRRITGGDVEELQCRI